MNDSAIMECGLVFLENLTVKQCENFTFSKDTRKQLDSFLSNKVSIVSMDIYTNCMNIGLGPQKSMSIAKRFSNLKFSDLYHVDDADLLRCPSVGQKTVDVIKEFTKPVVKVSTKINDGRLDLMSTLLPTKVVNALSEAGINYADELRYTYLYEDFNCCYKNIITGFYNCYIQFNNSLQTNDYIHKVFEAIILKFRNSLNNFCRHNFKNGDSNLESTRYFSVSYLNELITRVGFDTQGAFKYFTGDTDACVKKLNNRFRNISGMQCYEVSKELLTETTQVMHLLGKHIARNNI